MEFCRYGNVELALHILQNFETFFIFMKCNTILFIYNKYKHDVLKDLTHRKKTVERQDL